MYFEELLELENDENIWNFSLNDKVLLWPQIRYSIFWEMQKKRYNLSNPHIKETLNIKDIIRYIISIILKNPFRIKKNQILILNFSINYILLYNKYYKDRIYDEYIFGEKGFQKLERVTKLKIREPKLIKAIYIDLIYAIIKVIKTFIIINHVQKTKIYNFVKYLSSKEIIRKNDKRYYILMIENIYRANILKNIIFKLYLSFVKPRCIIIQCAHYGGDAILINIAKKKRIPTIEMQHGYIGEGHLAYNYNEKFMHKAENILPDYIFTYGEYWNSKIRSPSKKIAIGNAFLEKVMNENIEEKKESEMQRRLILISSGTMPEKILEISEKIYQLFNGQYELVFRPHPSEMPDIDRRYNELKEYFSIDTGNIYNTIKNAEILISLEMSTLLFESVGIVKTIVLINNKATNEYIYDKKLPFYIIESIKEISLIKELNNINIEREELWKSNARENFIVSIDKILREYQKSK